MHATLHHTSTNAKPTSQVGPDMDPLGSPAATEGGKRRQGAICPSKEGGKLRFSRAWQAGCRERKRAHRESTRTRAPADGVCITGKRANEVTVGGAAHDRRTAAAQRLARDGAAMRGTHAP